MATHTQHTTEKESERDLLLVIVVTFSVFHLDTSELNTGAATNTVQQSAQRDVPQKMKEREQPTKQQQHKKTIPTATKNNTTCENGSDEKSTRCVLFT